MLWTQLIPGEFNRMVKEHGLCVIPMGSLERHGEHLPFGCDVTIAETIAGMAAELSPAVVFPGYFLAQVHEASCFPGTVNLPQSLAVEVLSKVLDSIAANGFKKIAVLNFHGGNKAFLDYFSMSRMDEERDYSLYVIDPFNVLNEDEKRDISAIWETRPLGHACEEETSIYMACQPGLVRLDLASEKPSLPLNRLENLRSNGIENAFWWYADYPQNVVGYPKKATEAKGVKALEILAKAVARAFRVVKEDVVAPELQKEFLNKVRKKETHCE